MRTEPKTETATRDARRSVCPFRESTDSVDDSLPSASRGEASREEATVVVPTARERFAAVRVQRAWRRFATERGVSAHLAARFLATRPAPSPAHATPGSDPAASPPDDARAFDAFAAAARDKEVLRAARLFFARVAGKLDALDRSARVARRAGETARETATFAAILSPKRSCEGEPVSKTERDATVASEAFPARELLCAYAVVSFPEVVLGAAGASEACGKHARALRESARETTRAADALARALTGTTRTSGTDENVSDAKEISAPVSPRAALRRFAEEWHAYASAFERWKARDARALERELTRAAVEMETSARRACGAAARAEDFPEGSDARAILEALAEDACVLRGKVRGLTGVRGVERFNRAVRAARTEQLTRDDAAETEKAVSGRGAAAELSGATRAARRVEARKAARASRLAAYAARRAKARGEASEACPPDAFPARARTSAEAHENEAIMHELLVDPEWRLSSRDETPPRFGAPSEASADALPARVREAMTCAFWDATRDALLESDVQRVARVVAELGDALASLCPEHHRSEAEAALLLRLAPAAASAALARVVADPSALADAFAEVTREASRMLARLGAPARDARAARDAQALERRVGAFAAEASALSSNGDARGARRVVADAVAHALRELFAALALVRRDVANAAVARLAPLARRDARGAAEGSAWAWRRFAARYGVAEAGGEGDEGGEGASARLAAALPRTSAWLAAATRAAHALDASIPALALDSVDGSGSGSRGSEGASAPVAFTMRSGTASAAAKEADQRVAAKNTAAPVSVRATRAASPEGLVRVALVSLVASDLRPDEARGEPSDGNGGALPLEMPETLEFDAARLRDARRAFDALRVRAACLFVATSFDAGADSVASCPAARLGRLDALLADPTTSADDLALEMAGGAGAKKEKLAAVAAALRRLLAPRDPSGARIKRALAEALGVRALLGPPTAAASPAAAARAAAAAAPLLRAGFRGPEGAAVAKDVASLAARLDASVGRVTWDVHARAYGVLAERALAAEDEI